MKRGVAIKADYQLHRAEIEYHIPTIQDGDVLKLTQAGHCIYLIYRLSEAMDQR